jgi:hypothetical protein
MIPLSIGLFRILTYPDVFDKAAVTILKVVDFPAPFGPNNPKIYPLSTEKLLFLIAINPLL